MREHPDCIFWHDFMYTTYDTNFLDFLPEEAIRQSILFIKENYRNPTEQVKEWISASRGKFLSESQMNRFTEYCADYCSDVLEYLLADNLIPVDAVSVINLQCFPPFPAVISANSAE